MSDHLQEPSNFKTHTSSETFEISYVKDIKEWTDPVTDYATQPEFGCIQTASWKWNKTPICADYHCQDCTYSRNSLFDFDGYAEKNSFEPVDFMDGQEDAMNGLKISQMVHWFTYIITFLYCMFETVSHHFYVRSDSSWKHLLIHLSTSSWNISCQSILWLQVLWLFSVRFCMSFICLWMSYGKGNLRIHCSKDKTNIQQTFGLQSLCVQTFLCIACYFWG